MGLPILLKWFDKKHIWALLTFFAVMFSVMLFVNPMIDGHNGEGVLSLQLAFDKSKGVTIVEGWWPDGPDRFARLIGWDYLYAVSYSWFMAALLSFAAVKNGLEKKKFCRFLVPLALSAGGMDWIENTMELFFVNNLSGYPSGLFFVHSVIAAVKWAVIGFVLTVILFLLQKNIRKRDKRPAVMR